MASTPDIIGWAKVSQYLSRKDIIVSTALNGGKIDTRHPRLLRMERLSLEDLYAYSPSSTYLVLLGNYVVALCGKYLFEAQLIFSGSGGGALVNPTTGNASSIKGIRIELVVGTDLAVGATSYTIPYAYVVEDTVSVELPQANIPEEETNQFSYSIAYGAISTIISFTNDDGAGNNLGVQSGMLLIIMGLRYVTVVSTGTTTTPIEITVYGNEIVADVYSNPIYAGFNLSLLHNGVKTLTKDVHFTVNAGGGFTLIGTYAGLTLTSADEFILSPNGLL